MTVFRLSVRNYEYPKVGIDPAGILMRSADGRKWYSLARGLFDRMDWLRETLFPADAVYSGQETSGYVVFPALDADVRDVQVTLSAVLMYDYLGEPVRAVDLACRFTR